MSEVPEGLDKALVDALREACWRLGRLDWKLDSNQLRAYEGFYASTAGTYVLECGRRVGKTWLIACLCLEAAIRNPGSRVCFGAQTGEAATNILQPIIAKLIADAPLDVRPEFVRGEWVFPVGGPAAGSKIVLFGLQNATEVEKGRGTEAIFLALDECGFSPILSYALNSVLSAQLMTTKGRTVLSSSPAKSPGHEFSDLADAAANRGAYFTCTIHDNPRMTPEEIGAYLEERAASLGMSLAEYEQTSDHQREHLARRVIDDTLAYVPRFSKVRDSIVTEHKQPPFFDLYIAMDPGASDLTGILFGYFDYKTQQLVITHEELLARANTKTQAETVLKVLAAEYPNRKPYSAVVDDRGAIVSMDLETWGCPWFCPAQKDDSEAAVANMDVWIGSNKVLINPRCTSLIRQLTNAVRKSPGGDLARTKKDSHFDLVSSLKYMIREAEAGATHNPYPLYYDYNSFNTARPPPESKPSLADALLRGSHQAKRNK